MKRVLMLAVVVLMIGSNVTEAHHSHYVPLHDRAYYCPYVGGLVPADMVYRPYAFDYHHSGLVPYWVDYCPYAFSYKNPSGLVSAYGSSYWNQPAYQKPSQPEKSFEEMRKDYEEWLQLRQARVEKLRQKAVSEENGKDVIYRFLKSRGIEFWMRNGLCIQNRTLSCEFLLKGGNIIKYWDPEAIAEVVIQKPEYGKPYQRYADNWMKFSKEYQGKTYEIKSSKASEIIQKLNEWIK